MEMNKLDFAETLKDSIEIGVKNARRSSWQSSYGS